MRAGSGLDPLLELGGYYTLVVRGQETCAQRAGALGAGLPTPPQPATDPAVATYGKIPMSP